MANDTAFVDTSGFIALLNADDSLLSVAARVFQQFGEERRRLVTTTWVFAETGNGLARTRLRSQFCQAVRIALRSDVFTLIEPDDRLFQDSLDLYEQSADKTWGLVGCCSFEVMRDRDIHFALTADRHFEQAGFRALLREVNTDQK